MSALGDIGEYVRSVGILKNLNIVFSYCVTV